MPRHRNAPFKALVFENYSRSEAALIASMAERTAFVIAHCMSTVHNADVIMALDHGRI